MNTDDRNVFAIYVSYYIKVKLTLSGMGGELSLKLPFTLIHVDNTNHGTENQEYDLLAADKCHTQLLQQHEHQCHELNNSKNKHDLKLDNADNAIRDLDQICTDFASSIAMGTTPTPTKTTITTFLTPHSLLHGTTMTTTATVQSISMTSPSPSLVPLTVHDNSNYDNRDSIINNLCQKSNQSMLASSVIDKIEPITSDDINEISGFCCGISGSSNVSSGGGSGMNATHKSSDIVGSSSVGGGGNSGGSCGSTGVNINNKAHHLRNMRHDTIEMTSIDVDDRDFDEHLVVGTTTEDLLTRVDVEGGGSGNSGIRKNSETTCVEVHATSS